MVMVNSLRANESANRSERTRARAAAQIVLRGMILCAVSCGCRHTSASLHSMVRTELYFGAPRREEQWREFVDQVVTPRFPDGFSVLNADGQYRDARGNVQRERSKVIVIVHENATRPDESIEEIRTSYKKMFDQESVLRVDEPVRAGF